MTTFNPTSQEGNILVLARWGSLQESDPIEKGYAAAAKMGVRLDKHAIHEDWRRLVEAFPEPPAKPVAHWIAYCREQARMIR